MDTLVSIKIPYDMFMRQYTIPIQKLCQKINTTPEQVARKLKIPVKELMQWENNISTLSIKEAIQLSKFFNTSLEDLTFQTTRCPIDLQTYANDPKSLDQIINLSNNNWNHIQDKNRIRNKNERDYNNPGGKIKFVRIEILGLGQYTFSELIHCSRTLVEKWEEGLPPEYMHWYCEIADLSNITLDALVFPEHALELSTRNFSEKEYQLIKLYLSILDERRDP